MRRRWETTDGRRVVWEVGSTRWENWSRISDRLVKRAERKRESTWWEGETEEERHEKERKRGGAEGGKYLLLGEWRVCMYGIYYHTVWIGNVCNEYHRIKNCEGRTGVPEKQVPDPIFLLDNWGWRSEFQPVGLVRFITALKIYLVINYGTSEVVPQSGGSVILPVCFRRFHCWNAGYSHKETAYIIEWSTKYKLTAVNDRVPWLMSCLWKSGDAHRNNVMKKPAVTRCSHRLPNWMVAV